MPTPLPRELDWKSFGASFTSTTDKGDLFQELCADLFRTKNYRVKVMGPGGDGGRDLEIFLDNTIDWAALPAPDWWVECKSRTSKDKKAIDDDLLGNFAMALKSRVGRLILMTNHKFKNTITDYAREINRTPDFALRARIVEREELEDLIRATPAVFCKYFAPGTVESDWEAPKPDAAISVDTTLSARFEDDPVTVEVIVRNRTFRDRKVTIRSSDGHDFKQTLTPFDEGNAVWTGCSEADELTIDCTVDGERQDVAPITVPMPKTRIDKIYTDQCGNREGICALLRGETHVFLTGAPGVGKSRLIREAAKMAGRSSTTIDLSVSDYRYDLAQHLLFHSLSIDARLAALLPSEHLANLLIRSGCDPQDAPIVASYVRETSANADPQMVIGSAVRLFTSVHHAGVIFIDNVHRFSMFDLQTLRAVLAEPNLTIVCTARGAEIEQFAVREFFDEMVAEGRITSFELAAARVADNIRAFLGIIAADDTTAAFLRKYGRAPSFQELLINLKDLRMGGLVQQVADGRMRVAAARDAEPGAYRQIVEQLTARLVARHGRSAVEKVLGSAAIYGYYFPEELVEDIGGDAAAGVLNDLVDEEIVIIDRKVPYRSLNLRFDHELTREVVLHSLPALVRQQLERSVARVVSQLDPNDAAYSPQLLSSLYERLNDIPRAVKFGNEYGARLRSRASLDEAYRAYQHSLELLRDLYRDTTAEFYDLEISTLAELIDVGITVTGTTPLYPYMRELQVTLQLRPDPRRTAQAHQFLAVYFGERYDQQNALHHADEALVISRRIQDERSIVQLLNLKGNLTKIFGNKPIVAANFHREALRRARALGDPKSIADSAGELGAVFLENGKAPRALRWWKLSNDVLVASADYAAIAYSSVDYSHLLALCRPNDPEVEPKLLAALSLSRRVNVKRVVVRALINHANWLFFHGGDRKLPFEETAEALEITTAIGEKYLELMARFSSLTFSEAEGLPLPPGCDVAILSTLLRNYLPANAPLVADNRLTNILKYLRAFHPTAVDWAAPYVEKLPLAAYRTPSIAQDFVSVEAGNIYLRGRSFITYY